MVLGPTCECDRTCQEPTWCNCNGPETCVCPDGFLMNNTGCVPEQECGCYHDEGRFVLVDGYEYVNHNCSEKCICSNDQLNCKPDFPCSPNASCRVEDGIRRCYCDDGYVGDGETCKLYTDCYDAYQAGHRQDGVFTILPYRWPESSFNVSCDMTTSGGGWTVIQRYIKDPLVQYSPIMWEVYKTGFGSPSGRHWLGNEKIFFLTTQRNYTLRFDFVTAGGSATYQEYSMFKIANESDNYRLIELGNNSGNAGDGMDGSLGQQFSSGNRDNDECERIDCSRQHAYVGWWFSNKWCNECCNDGDPACFWFDICHRRCTKANVNGDPSFAGITFKIFWNDTHNITSTEMKIRPVE
ncbi:Angiopoietin-1 [Holothuria leucospilota]|uniref:Angiopoietin-1 n=1 Tax=Holothuria leucospilota TaxID=206669 RepID=A0A9Q0YS10_HOLLE|nr:Angiopoietin-1 [Holothuria leucospilota]